MQVRYRTKTLEKECTDATAASKKYGMDMARKIQMRVDEIRASESVEKMLQFRIGRCHRLKGGRKVQYAVDLVHPYRLVFEIIGSEAQIANIIEIVDYH